MRLLIGLATAAFFALLSSTSVLAQTSHYAEMETVLGGGLNDTFATAESLNGSYTGISGDIGSSGASSFDSDDFFLFGFDGSSTTFEMVFESCDGCGTSAAVEAFLYDSNEKELLSFYYYESKPIALVAGNYYLRVALGEGVDPPFVITGADSGGDPLTFTNPIPEPETYAMLLAGLGLLGWHARRRKLKQAA